jgi:hypothetical protein
MVVAVTWHALNMNHHHVSLIKNEPKEHGNEPTK